MKNDWSQEYKTNITSQFGEDGIIKKILEVIGEKNKYCVEFGALDGKHHSNTWNLFVNNNWSGVLIEADPTYFERMKIRYENFRMVKCLNKFVTFDGENSLDKLLLGNNVPKDLDLLVIDIDGNDIHVWESLLCFKPRVVVIEFNPSIPARISFVQPRDMSVQQGSSLAAMVELGKKKGYELVATTEVNAFFVEKEEYPKFFMNNNNPSNLWRHEKCLTQLFQLYDGTIMISGCTDLIWHKKKINIEKLQVLSFWERRYPSGISSRKYMRLVKYYLRRAPLYTVLQRIRKSI